MNQKSDAALRSLCAEIRPDDGIDPQLLKRQKQRQQQNQSRESGDRHLWQYCKAARRSLEGALPGIGRSELTSDLSIISVEPLRGGSVLLVAVSAPQSGPDDIPAIEACLQQCSGLLRATLSGEIRRKRVPHLRFRVIPENA